MKMIKIKDKLSKQKRIYKILALFVAFGILIGAIYPLFLNSSNKDILTESIKSFFESIKSNNIDTLTALKNSIYSNGLLCIGIWLLGISIIGIPIIIILIIYKGFILGFSFSSIISVYKFKGILGAFLYTFPVSIISLITTMLIGFYAIKFSSKLFRYLFLKENINFNYFMNRYIKILCICLISYILCTLFEVYIMPQLLKLFTLLI